MKTTTGSKADTHATVYGTAGERPRLAGLFRASWPLFPAVGAAGYLLRALFPLPRLTTTVIGILFLALGLLVAIALIVTHTRLTAYVKGARGEEQVARALVFLPAEYAVFHGVTIRAAECDHIVVGPTGVFAIETKSWRGEITVEKGEILYNGKAPTRSPLEQVKGFTARLRKHLLKQTGITPEIQPVVCFAGDNLRGESQGVSGVIVCNARRLTEVVEEGCDEPLSSADRATVTACLKKLID